MPAPLSREEIAQMIREQTPDIIRTYLEETELADVLRAFRREHRFPSGVHSKQAAAFSLSDHEHPIGVTQCSWISFNAIRAPGTKPATFKEWGISGVWEFSDATDDTIVANVKLPNDMDKTVAPYFLIGWSTNTAVITETARWQMEYLYTAAGEDTTAAAQGTVTANSNAISQADGLNIAALPAFAIPSSLDQCVHIRLKRLGAHGDDDLTDTAELHGMCMIYTSDKLGTEL